MLKKGNDMRTLKKETKVVELDIYIPSETEISGSATLWVSEDGTYSKPLRPCTTAEATFSTPVSEDEASASDPDFDGTYLFLSNPNGRYYHFRTYAGGGDSQWDGFWHYEEHFTASSSLSSSSGNTYGADNLTNTVQIDDQLMGGDRRTAWCEGVAGYGIGERISMSIRTKGDYAGMEENICFTQLMIVNGYAKDAATWKNNSRVKTLSLYVGNEYLCDLALEDVINPQIFNLEEVGAIYPSQSGKLINLSEKEAFPNIPPSSILWKYEIPKSPIYQTDLKFVIQEVYPGDKYDDTCITGIAVNVYTGIY
jgi:hypothetical protein